MVPAQGWRANSRSVPYSCCDKNISGVWSVVKFFLRQFFSLSIRTLLWPQEMFPVLESKNLIFESLEQKVTILHYGTISPIICENPRKINPHAEAFLQSSDCLQQWQTCHLCMLNSTLFGFLLQSFTKWCEKLGVNVFFHFKLRSRIFLFSGERGIYCITAPKYKRKEGFLQ